MTRDEAKKIIRYPVKPLALVALSYANLTDSEMDVLILRFMRGHTQEETAEEMSCTVNGLRKWEREVIARFARYADCKRRNAPEAETLEALESMADMLRRVVTEIYHLCGSEKERSIVRGLKSKIP